MQSKHTLKYLHLNAFSAKGLSSIAINTVAILIYTMSRCLCQKSTKPIIARFQKNLPGFLVMGGNSIQNNKTHFRAYCKTRLVRLYGVDTTINARVQRSKTCADPEGGQGVCP